MNNNSPPQPSPPPTETQEVIHPEKYVVEFIGPYSFKVPNSVNKEQQDLAYPIVLNDIEAEVRLGGSEGGRSAFKGSGAASFPRDRHGLLLNQKVQIHFFDDYIQSLPNDIREPVYKELILGSKTTGLHKHLIDDAVDYYNRFIECYRVTTDSYWMRSVIPNEILNFTIKKIEGGNVIDETSLGLSGGALSMGTIAPEQDAQLRKALQENSNVTISRELELDIQDKMDLGEYTIAIINSNQLFTFWTRREYKKMLRAKGKSDQEAEDRMWNSGSDQYHHIKTIYDMIESDIDISIKNIQEWEMWYRHCRDKRNDLVHEGKRAKELDAIYAFYYTQKAMAKFKQKFIAAFNGRGESPHGVGFA